MARLPFITFEGTEGCGKSTQVKRLTARMEKSKVPFLVTREPGGTSIGEKIKQLLQFDPDSSGMTAEAELLLFAASRSQLVREVIMPALERGECVISDRFYDSTTVYQGAARKLNAHFVRQLNAFAINECEPNITFIFDVDLATAKTRMEKTKRRPDRMEQEPDEFYERVRLGYRDLAEREPKRIVLIDGTKSPDKIDAEIWETLVSRFSQIENRRSKI